MSPLIAVDVIAFLTLVIAWAIMPTPTSERASAPRAQEQSASSMA